MRQSNFRMACDFQKWQVSQSSQTPLHQKCGNNLWLGREFGPPPLGHNHHRFSPQSLRWHRATVPHYTITSAESSMVNM